MFFFTNGGTEANEAAIRIARLTTGRHEILVRYRSCHGVTAPEVPRCPAIRGAGPRNLPDVVRVLDPYHGIERA